MHIRIDGDEYRRAGAVRQMRFRERQRERAAPTSRDVDRALATAASRLVSEAHRAGRSEIDVQALLAAADIQLQARRFDPSEAAFATLGRMKRLARLARDSVVPGLQPRRHFPQRLAEADDDEHDRIASVYDQDYREPPDDGEY